MLTEVTKSTDIDRSAYLKLLVTLVIVGCVPSFSSSMIYPAMKAMYVEFSDPIMIGWIFTAYVLVNAVTATVGARLGDLYGRRRILAIVLVMTGIGSILCAVSDDIYSVIAGRVAQGLTGPILALSVGVTRENLPTSRIPFGIGLLGATAMVSSACAFLLAGVIVDHLPWRMIFYFSAVYSFLSAIPLMMWIPKSKPAGVSGKLDIVGGLLFTPGVAGVLFAIGKIRDWGFLDARTLGLFAVSLIFLVIFVAYELRHSQPFINVRLLGNRQIALANLILVSIGLGSMNTGVIFALFLQQPPETGIGLGLSGTMTGMVMFAALMMGVFGGPLAGWMAGRWGGRRPMMAGSLLMIAAWIGILIEHHSFPWVVATLLVNGLGQAIIFSGAPILVTECAPADRTSEANGLSQVSRHTAKAAGVQAISFLISFYAVQTPGVEGSFPTAAAYVILFGGAAAASVGTLIASLCLPRTGGYGQASGHEGKPAVR